jgi:hypothetical protein
MGVEERYVEKVMDDRSLLERIALYLPGYRGYREKNLRRETDQLIRNNVNGVMRTGMNDLEWSYREAVNNFPFDDAERINRVLMKMDATTQKVLHAKYGYSGIWEAAKVQENELSNLLRYDASLIELSQRLRTETAALKELTRRKDLTNSMDLADRLESKIDEFESILLRRDEIMIGVQKVD